jgi:hypothetical protein
LCLSAKQVFMFAEKPRVVMPFFLPEEVEGWENSLAHSLMVKYNPIK